MGRTGIQRAPSLTARQREILEQIAQGRANPQIAEQIGNGSMRSAMVLSIVEYDVILR